MLVLSFCLEIRIKILCRLGFNSYYIIKGNVERKKEPIETGKDIQSAETVKANIKRSEL
jgi:hypothetical protein